MHQSLYTVQLGRANWNIYIFNLRSAIQTDHPICIYQLVNEMREHRSHMVQTFRQYNSFTSQYYNRYWIRRLYLLASLTIFTVLLLNQTKKAMFLYFFNSSLNSTISVKNRSLSPVLKVKI